MAQKKIPARQCIGCMTSRPKRSWCGWCVPLRGDQHRPGGQKARPRGIPLPKPGLPDKGKKKKALERCFEQPVPAEVYDALAAELASAGEGVQHG